MEYSSSRLMRDDKSGERKEGKERRSKSGIRRIVL